MSDISKPLDIDDKALGAFRSIEEHFGFATDYRRQKSVKHRLIHIIFFTLCAVTAGANDLVGVEMYLQANADWLVKLFDLKYGMPSLGTLRTVYMLLNPEVLSRCFVEWVESLVARTNLKGISIDGKAQRGTALPDEPNSFVHIVSAWASEHNLTMGQVKVDGKSNEITAIPKLLDLIDIEGTVITMDAMGTQTKIAEQIVDRKGDYILALKGNHSTLQAEVENFFRQAFEYGDEGIDFTSFLGNRERRRNELRKIYMSTDPEFIESYKPIWKGLRSIVCVESERTVKGQTTKELRYYISSMVANPEEIGRLIRGHWGIESAHWVLDVAFREDQQLARAGHIAENLSLMRRISMNYLKQDRTVKAGIANKRLRAAYSKEYLLQTLGVKFYS